MYISGGRGTDEHARTKWAGQFGYFAHSVAVSIIANSTVGHPLESFPVSSLQNTMSTCIIIL